MTEFLECLFVRYDFEGAQHKLAQCEEVLDGDFFLSALREEFVENARLFIFETYCRIHQARPLATLEESLLQGSRGYMSWVGQTGIKHNC